MQLQPGALPGCCKIRITTGSTKIQYTVRYIKTQVVLDATRTGSQYVVLRVTRVHMIWYIIQSTRYTQQTAAPDYYLGGNM